MAELNPRIRATSDPVLAERLGLTHWDAELGQYTAARAGEPLERPGEGVFFLTGQELVDLVPDLSTPLDDAPADEPSEPEGSESPSQPTPKLPTLQDSSTEKDASPRTSATKRPRSTSK